MMNIILQFVLITVLGSAVVVIVLYVFVRPWIMWRQIRPMTTPEGKIKAKVKALLTKYDCYQFWPVQTGLGAAGLDCHAYKMLGSDAIAFFVETKVYGKEPTPRQQLLIDNHELKGAKCFVVDNDHTLRELEQWLQGEVQACYIKSPTTF